MDGISGDQAAIHYKGAAVHYTDTAAVPSGVIDDIAILDFSPFVMVRLPPSTSTRPPYRDTVGQDCAIQQLYRAALSDIQHPAIGPLLPGIWTVMFVRDTVPADTEKTPAASVLIEVLDVYVTE